MLLICSLSSSLHQIGQCCQYWLYQLWIHISSFQCSLYPYPTMKNFLAHLCQPTKYKSPHCSLHLIWHQMEWILKQCMHFVHVSLGPLIFQPSCSVILSWLKATKSHFFNNISHGFSKIPFILLNSDSKLTSSLF